MTADTHPVQFEVHFDKIGQIALTVTEIARSKDFYQNTLGMKFLFDAGGTLLYFKVEDIHQTHEFLKEKGVVFHQRPHLVAKMPDHELWLAFLKDPDENILGVMSEVPLS